MSLFNFWKKDRKPAISFNAMLKIVNALTNSLGREVQIEKEYHKAISELVSILPKSGGTRDGMYYDILHVLIPAILKAEKRGHEQAIKNKCKLIIEAAEQNFKAGLLRAAEIADKYYGFSDVHDSYVSARAGSHKIADKIRKEVEK